MQTHFFHLLVSTMMLQPQCSGNSTITSVLNYLQAESIHCIPTCLLATNTIRYAGMSTPMNIYLKHIHYDKAFIQHGFKPIAKKDYGFLLAAVLFASLSPLFSLILLLLCGNSERSGEKLNSTETEWEKKMTWKKKDEKWQMRDFLHKPINHKMWAGAV